MEDLPRVVLLGHSGVGKTSLCQQYVSHQIESNHIPTIGSQEYTTRVLFQGKSHKVVIEDSQGSNTTQYDEIVRRHHRLSSQFATNFLDTDQQSQSSEKMPLLTARDLKKTGFIIVYDGTNPRTLSHALEVIDFIFTTYKVDPKRIDGKSPVSVFLLRNKCDLRSKYPFDPNICDGTAKGLIQHFETSAKFNEKVLEVFRRMFSIILSPPVEEPKSPGSMLSLPIPVSIPSVDSQSCKSPCLLI
eukprot:TRINITY_DN9241_c0_g1_i1.p1 TRINITY_DN9241_c0_g1~~TRINITY_DN9241_c0_g1_i1.p1  ORF type:complete len:244 (-),score=52.80 TRINITY_DN9241_c0_g1_i1:271-1002(-)